MIFKTNKTDEDLWAPISDIMSALMIVFLFISVSYMINVKKDKDEIEKIKDQIEEIAVTYQRKQIDLYNDLKNEFADDLEKWGAEIDSQKLSFRFKEPEVLFDAGSSNIKPKFKNILNDFFPRYITKLYDEKYKNDIEEIRIEGHTSSEWQYKTTDMQAYFYNMELSQNRTRAVLEYVLNNTIIKFNNDKKDWIKATTTANGLSSSKLIFSDDETAKEDKEKSRRVEFRVLTSADTAIVKILNIGR
ncbi:MAG: OmpA family protein [Chitinivibrionia bacterium]|nr:OmpA family protein [Chitinivibrionia bacterium]